MTLHLRKLDLIWFPLYLFCFRHFMQPVDVTLHLFFKGHSREGFLGVFIRDCEFITGSNCIGKPDDSNEELSLLAFYWIIGSVYFRKYSRAFEADNPHGMFVSVSVPGHEPLSHHTVFLSAIKDGHFHRISGESEWMPSTDALRLLCHRWTPHSETAFRSWYLWFRVGVWFLQRLRFFFIRYRIDIIHNCNCDHCQNKTNTTTAIAKLS